MHRKQHGRNQWAKCSRMQAEFRRPVRRYVANILNHCELTPHLFSLALYAAPRNVQSAFIALANKYKSADEETFERSGRTGIDDVVNTLMRTSVPGRMSLSEMHRRLSMGFNRYHRISKRVTSKRIIEISTLFGLNQHETMLIEFLYCICIPPLTFFITNETNGVTDVLRTAARTIGISTSAIFKIMSSNGKLLSSGIIDPLTSGNLLPVELNDHIVQYIWGISGMPLTDRFFKIDNSSTHALESCRVTPSEAKIIKDIITCPFPANLLLYGKPGAGKTEFARALCAKAGLKAYFIKHTNDKSDRRMALTAAQCCSSEKNSVIIIDEADRILNTSGWFFRDSNSPDKGWLNDFLDNSRHRMIWITNDTDMIEESTMRRFTFSLKFGGTTGSDRRAIWKGLLKETALQNAISDRKIADMSARYAISLGGIASAIKSLATIQPESGDDPEQILETIVRSHATAINAVKSAANTVSIEHYDPAAININIAPEKLAEPIRNLRDRTSHCGTGMLFWGPPGTGKTALAHYLADDAGVELIQKRASELLSKWVGDTEHNIADAFREAERANAVLLIDEADSMLIERATAHRSWEVSQTNELLTQMETFSGVLICCTNMLDRLDAAALRRFAWKIQFGYLKPEAISSLLRRYFPAAATLSKTASAQITAMNNLTAGDIKAAWQRLSTTGEKHTAANIIQALREELSVKKGTAGSIGF